MSNLIAVDKGETVPINLDDPPQFHYEINYVIRTWFDHRKHGTYPKLGGYDCQCPFLMADWHTLNLYHTRVEHGITSFLDMPTTGEHVDTLLEG
jgi:hypothetical protein